jgi:undecaprenyl-diphosphatase
MAAFIFVSAAMESLTIIGVFIPGALVMFGLGALVGLGRIEFLSVYWWSALGAVVGDALSFWIGRVFHQGIRVAWPFNKYPEMITRSEEFFCRHGGKSILFGRFFGPVRGTIPTVAGMMDMSWHSFMVANVVSAILWAPAYLIPGMAFGASLEIASWVAGRLVVLILIITISVWITTWLVKYLVRLFQVHATGWAQRLYTWSQSRSIIGQISASFLDHSQCKSQHLAMIATLFIGSSIIFLTSISLHTTTDQRLPNGLDQSLYYFLQELHTPQIDPIMVFIAAFGDFRVICPVSFAVFSWLIWHKQMAAVLYWLVALGLGMATDLLFQLFLKVSNPMEMAQSVLDYSFHSSHATLHTMVFGSLAVLIARGVPRSFSWITYLVAAFLIIPIAFARLYLGTHLLTATLAGLFLGLVYVSVLGVVYNSYPKTAPPYWRSLLACSTIVFLIADSIHVNAHYDTDLQNYQPKLLLRIQTRESWLQDGWRRLPQQRLDFNGNLRQEFVLQWAGTHESLRNRLREAGWESAPLPNLRSVLLCLSPKVELRELPVLPQIHNGSEDDLTMVHYANDPNIRWLLRFWDINIRLKEGSLPIWVGSVNQQRLEPRLSLLTLAVDDPQAQVPVDLLAPAWKGLQTQIVSRINNSREHITLIVD